MSMEPFLVNHEISIVHLELVDLVLAIHYCVVCLVSEEPMLVTLLSTLNVNLVLYWNVG